MNSQSLSKKKIPDDPGVYFFVDSRNKPLYIGRATSLRDRTKSYFGRDLIATRGPMLVDMVFKAKDLKWQITDSVLESLILEANLIKKYKPKYNTKEKDDKSFNYICITKEELPKVLIIREREIDFKNLKTNNYKLETVYGPYPKGQILKQALIIIRKIFPFLDDKSKIKSSYEFYRQLGLTPNISDSFFIKEYKKNIYNLKLFLNGQKIKIIKNLEKEMHNFSKKQNFEKAGEIKKKIFTLNHIQDIALIKDSFSKDDFKNEKNIFRIEAYDIAHLSGKEMVGVMTVLEDGEVAKNEYRKFKIKGFTDANDTGALKEIIERRFGHSEWRGPALVVVDGGKAQLNTALKALKTLDLPIPVVSVVKDEKHQPKGFLGDKKIIEKYQKEILLVNNEAHRFAIKYHRGLLKKRLIF